MPKLYSIRPSLTFRGRRFLGIRGWSGKPTHPPLTDFPIVCYALAALFDVISWFGWPDQSGEITARVFSRAATLVLAVGFVVSLATALTGFWDWWKGLARDHSAGVIGRAQHTQVWRTANWHMTVMLTTTVVVIIDLIVRYMELDPQHPTSSGLVTVLSLIAAGLVTLGATYGGTLVYEYQFNIEPLKGSTAWDETEVDQLPGDRTKPAPAEPAS